MPLALIDDDAAAARASAHAAAVDAYAGPFLKRRHEGKKHPVEDFLFTYYTLTPGQLRRWHPGAGAALTGNAAEERLGWKFYRPLTEEERLAVGRQRGKPLAPDEPAATMDAEAFMAKRGSAVDFAEMILSRTLARPGRLGCFGLHEWAMAYRSELNGHRHEYLELRLGAEGTDGVVESSRISCTHFDAFRFYQPQAVPLNEFQPTRETQRDLEQPGCLHANMDVYKWAYKLVPLLPSELVFEAFELAYRIRAMDMQAAPYDLEAWGYEPLRIETPAGRAEYVRRQQAFMTQAQGLRERVLAELKAARGSAGHRSPATT